MNSYKSLGTKRPVEPSASGHRTSAWSSENARTTADMEGTEYPADLLGEDIEVSTSELSDGEGTQPPECSQTWAGEGNYLLQVPRQRMSAAKMMVRSGLRCSRCFLKAWVCLCNRASRELNRRGTRSAQSEQYMLACYVCSLQVGGLRPSVGCNHDPFRLGLRGSSSTRQSARHLGWSASKSIRLWFSQVYMFVQHFMRSSNSPYPRSDPRCNSDRGPKSGAVMPNSYGHRGVSLLHFNSARLPMRACTGSAMGSQISTLVIPI